MKLAEKTIIEPWKSAENKGFGVLTGALESGAPLRRDGAVNDLL